MTRFGSISQLLEQLTPATISDEPAWEDVIARAKILSSSAATNGRVPDPLPIVRFERGSVLLGRAHRRRPGGRPVALVALGVLALVVVVAAAAYALGHPVIDFGKAKKGTRKVVDDFGSMQVGAPSPAMAPGVLPHEARVITTVRIDGKTDTLYVAPTTQGGFCDEWSHVGGGCRSDRHAKSASHIDAGGTDGPHGMTILDGSFFQAAGDRLSVEYADGEKSEIPFVWVTAPIRAGFYLYRVPDAHRRAGHQPVSITLYDASNRLLDREPELAGQSLDVVPHRLPGYPPLLVPTKAEWTKRTQLFAVHADDGARIGLWTAPERGGGTCFWTNQASGCTHAGDPVHGTIPPLATLGFQAGGKHVNLCCSVSTKIVRVEARFADGDRAELTPKDGYLVWPIPAHHYPLGHRLTKLIGYDNAGRMIATRQITDSQRGLYPCTKPKNYGYGVSMCP
jgi:hypothetical protein